MISQHFFDNGGTIPDYALAESYRPQTLDDVIGQDHIIRRLKFMVQQLHESGGDGGFPHLMFAGNAGTGKTSAAMALMRSAFGDDWTANFMELNASDERSIQVIRTKSRTLPDGE